MYETKELDAYLENLYDEKTHPGLSVCLRGPEGIIYERGFGYGDMEKTRPIGPNTVFGIASMSKSFASIACAILEAEGKLSFSDKVSKYFPEFSIPGTPDESVTLNELAMHTTGIPPLPLLPYSIVMNTPPRDPDAPSKLRDAAPNKMDTIEDIIDYISNSGTYETLGAPGEIFSYSNEGYALLSYVVDQAAGMTLEEFLEERVFKPLGMDRTVLDLDGQEAIAMANGDIVDLFNTDEDDNLYADQRWSILPPYRGCACVKSTPRDMTKYYQMISQYGEFEGKQVIDSKAIEILIGRQFPETEDPFYCYGLSKRVFHDKVICEHSGGLHGVSSHGGLIMGGYSATAICNKMGAGAQSFVNACYNFILGLPLDTSHASSIPSGNEFSMPEALVGTYRSLESTPYAECKVSIGEDGDLYAKYYDDDLKLLYCDKTMFSARPVDKLDEQRTSMNFLIRNGQAWAVRCYNRVYQRIED